MAKNLIFIFILGAIFGSFFKCLSDRFINHTKWWVGYSECEYCHHQLSFFDLIPLFSYLFLKGRCRYCHHKISFDYFISELLLAILFVLYVFDKDALDLNIINQLLFIAILFGIAICDIKSYEIPNILFVAIALNWLLFKVVFGFKIDEILIIILETSIIPIVLIIISFIMSKLLNKNVIGDGDIILYYLCSLYLKGIMNLFNLFLSCLIALIYLIISKKKKIPFAPMIAISTYLLMLYGEIILKYYLSLSI